MRILLLSDLHFEFYQRNGIFEFIDSLPTDVDVCILAGDISLINILDKVLSLFCSKFKHVVYVTGNHEYYESSKEKVHNTLNSITLDNFHWLNRDVVEIDGQRFVGCILWFPPTLNSKKYEFYLNDFRLIKNFSKWVYEENHKNQEFLKREVQKGDVVITHHLPSYNVVSAEYVGNPYNCYFVCDMEQIILSKKPKVWCFGHSHCSMHKIIGETKLISNPFGYKSRDVNSKFKKNFVIEV